MKTIFSLLFHMISIISYNILLGKQIKRIIAWLSQFIELPDIVCFQEFPRRHIESLRGYFEERGYAISFAQTKKLKRKHCTVLTLYKRNLFRLLEEKTVSLGYTRLEKAIFSAMDERHGLVLKLEFKGKSFVVCNTHLSAIAPHSKRREQLTKIVEAINGNTRSIIVGDFNYTSLVRPKSLIDFMENHGFQNGTKKVTTHRLFFLRQQLDYLFYKNITLQEIFVLHATFSDHLPLFARFRL